MTSSSAVDNLPALLMLTRAAAGPERADPPRGEARASARRGDDPAVKVDISPLAKALLERGRVELSDPLAAPADAAKDGGAAP